MPLQDILYSVENMYLTGIFHTTRMKILLDLLLNLLSEFVKIISGFSIIKLLPIDKAWKDKASHVTVDFALKLMPNYRNP